MLFRNIIKKPLLRSNNKCFYYHAKQNYGTDDHRKFESVKEPQDLGEIYTYLY